MRTSPSDATATRTSCYCWDGFHSTARFAEAGDQGLALTTPVEAYESFDDLVAESEAEVLEAEPVD